MIRIRTKYFEDIDYSDTSLYCFRYGLPGFEQERYFVFLSRPDSHPLIFMQSTVTPGLCFILLPALIADPEYELLLDDEALTALELPLVCQPRIGQDILCAVTVCARGNGEPPTVNLLAPIVVNLHNRIGIQAIQTQSGRSHRHPLVQQEQVTPCS